MAKNRFYHVGRVLWRNFARYEPSALALILANVLPLFGVIFLGWDAFAIVVLYWAENVVIGGINVVKIITCRPDPDLLDTSKTKRSEQSRRSQMQLEMSHDQAASAKLGHHGSKLLFVPFFIVHYGGFCWIHGAIVFHLFGREVSGFGPLDEWDGISRVLTQEHLWWAITVLAASHLFSFFTNYLGRGEYRRTTAPLLMIQPYARVVVLHFAILFGALAASALGSNIGVLIFLIAGKTALDLAFHLWERERNA